MKNKELRNYSERGVREGAKLHLDDVDYTDLITIFYAINGRKPNAVWQWLDNRSKHLKKTTVIVDTDDRDCIKKLEASNPMLIVNKKSLANIPKLNEYLNACNDALADGGYVWCHAQTSLLKRKQIYSNHPGITGKIDVVFFYIWHRVCAKLGITRWFYKLVTGGKNRSYPRTEILGRMYRAGFDIVDERFSMGEFYVLGQKARPPRRNKARKYGMIIRLGRVGYKGKIIRVFKFRSMYAYAEYLQPYLMNNEGLAKGGKYQNDYRINAWGRLFRSNLIDELPMILNVLRGEMKLVGVRPLSRAYYSLYTPEMQQMHISVKPGLMPPFYYEDKTPETIEEVQESEKRYIEAYRKHPFRTDWRYFWGIVRNIVFKKKRSK